MNNKLFLYALLNIKNRMYKNMALSLVLILIIFILFTVLFVKSSLEYELELNIKAMPEITLQKLQGGRAALVNENRIDALLEIKGVIDVLPRVWGYYFHEASNSTFVLVGYDKYLGEFDKSLSKIINNLSIENLDKTNAMIVGIGVAKTIKKSTGLDYINFVNNKMQRYKVPIISTFDIKSSIFTNDVILMPKRLSQKILQIPLNYVSDIILSVKNDKEIPTIVKKINILYPDFRIITKKSLKSSYKNIFDYKSGFFLLMFIIVLCAFFILVFEKASGLSQNEKDEIAILKAIGWRSLDIIYIKSIENLILSVFSFLLAFIFSYIYVFVFNASFVKNIFLGFSDIYSNFTFVYNLDFSLIILVFLLSVVVYLAAILIPIYKCAVIDAQKALR